MVLAGWLTKIRWLDYRARDAWAQGRFTDATRRATRAVELAERRPDPKQLPARLQALSTLAGLHCDLGDYVAAETVSRRAVTIAEQAPPGAERDRLLAEALTCLGDLCRRQARYDEAEAQLQRALGLVDAASVEPVQRAGVLNTLGITYKDAGRFQAAEGCYQTALATIQQLLGPDDPALASLYHNLAGLAYARRHHAHAEPLARRAVQVRERALGPTHPTVAADVAVLGAILAAQGHNQAAEALFRRALASFEDRYGPDHYEVAVNLNNLAALHQARGELEDAERCYRRALAIKQRTVGAAHPEVATLWNNLGVLHRQQGNYSQAEACYRAALDIYQAALASSHPTVLACRENYQRLLAEQASTP
jgi:tetratricopeptide (TPR) repeat protein